MDATFYTTNIVPQAPNCNQRGWERLEAYCRTLTKDGHVLQITAGPHGEGGEGKEGRREQVGKGRLEVTVPQKVWKVILVLPHADAEPTARTRTIAVVMPNDQSVDYDWAKYRVSVKYVEKLTGLRFWPDLPKETAREVKERVDEVEVRVPRQGRGGE
jgi:endonuclease G